LGDVDRFEPEGQTAGPGKCSHLKRGRRLTSGLVPQRWLATGRARERHATVALSAQGREAVVVGEMRVPRAKQERGLVRVTRLLVVEAVAQRGPKSFGT